MTENNYEMTIPDEMIIRKIYLVRGMKVMLDKNLAELYGVRTGNLNKAVKRNIKRFPADFMFQLTKEEYANLMFQPGISSWGGSRKLPYAFTEQGVAMLSGILNSDRAIQVNIVIMRAFVHLRRFLESNHELAERLNVLEKSVTGHDEKIQLIFDTINQLIENAEAPPARNPVGFRIQKE
jgi:hypothetical protein